MFVFSGLKYMKPMFDFGFHVQCYMPLNVVHKILQYLWDVLRQLIVYKKIKNALKGFMNELCMYLTSLHNTSMLQQAVLIVATTVNRNKQNRQQLGHLPKNIYENFCVL